MSDTSYNKAKADGKIQGLVGHSLSRDGGHHQVARMRDNRGKTKDVLTPSHQVVEYPHYMNKIYQPITPSPSVTIFGVGGKVELRLDAQSAKKLTDVNVRVNLSEVGGSNSVTPIPAPYLFERIEFWSNGGAGERIQTLYDDILFWNTALLSNENNAGILPALGSTTSWGTNSAISLSTNVDYYVPLMSWISVVKPFLQSAKKDILIKCYLRNGVINTGSGTLNVNAIEFGFDHEEMPEYDRVKTTNLLEQNVFRHTYLDYIPVSQTGTFTASTNIKISLENVQGKVAMLAFCLRASKSATSNGLITYASLGDDATVDIVSAQNTPMLGNGTPYRGKEIRSLIFNKNFPSSMSNSIAVYFIPFCNPVKAHKGNMDGYMYFDGSKIQLSLTPGAGFSSGSYTFDAYAYVFKDIYNDNMETLRIEG